jgi:hypothetical protein
MRHAVHSKHERACRQTQRNTQEQSQHRWLAKLRQQLGAALASVETPDSADQQRKLDAEHGSSKKEKEQ